MAILSAVVNAGDDALASQYNNLRTDLLTGDVAIAGVKTFSDDIYLAATKKLYLDGGGDTYIVESGANTVDVFIYGQQTLRFGSDRTASFSFDVKIAAIKKLYLDGGGNTYIVESAADNIDVYTGGVIAVTINDSQNTTLYGNVTINGVLAPGGNEGMMWDVVIFALDGTSSDTTAYVIDETKVYFVHSTGHDTATSMNSVSDGGITNLYTAAYLSGDVITLHYGTDYANTDVAQVIIFYIA